MIKNREEIYKSDLPHRAICVWQYLKYRSNKKGCCFPSVRRIGLDLRMSRSTVQRALRDLINAGYLQREFRFRDYGGQTSNNFYVAKH